MRKYFKLILFFCLLLLSSCSFWLITDSKVNILSFGAIADDQREDTEAIQKAIDFQSDKGGGIVVLPKGTFLVNAIKSVVLKDNITLEFEEGATIEAIPNEVEIYEVVRIKNVKNVYLKGDVNIKGERYNHKGTTGEWGFCISITGSENVNIENAEISNCWGDGIYIGSTEEKNFSSEIKISDVILSNNRRQGISIISVKNLEISNLKIFDTNGTAPESGIDLEPNFPTEYLENIKIIDLTTKNNNGYGLKIYLKNLQGSTNPVNIEIKTSDELSDGIFIDEYQGIKGEISVNDFFLHILK